MTFFPLPPVFLACFPAPDSCGLLLFGVYWLLILLQTVVFYRRAPSRALFHVIGVCMQLILLFKPCLLLPITPSRVGSCAGLPCLHQGCACMYHYKKPSTSRMDWALLPVIAHYLFCCRDRSFALVHYPRLPPSLIILFLARTRLVKQCTSMILPTHPWGWG